MRAESQPNGDVRIRGDVETPFKRGVVLQLTSDEMNGVRAFLRELQPGIYIKCSGCEKFKYGMTEVVLSNNGVSYLCQECA